MTKEENFINTLEKIRAAIVARDFESFAEHVDSKKFLEDGYGEVTEELAKNCDKFHKLYPHDLFFKFGATVLKIYNAKFKSVHLGFINRVIVAYFDKNLTAPKNFLSAPIDFSAVELRKFLAALSSNIKNISVEKDSAIAEVEIFGDSSYYGKVFGRLNFIFEFVEIGGVWRLKAVKNIPELVPPFLDMAERFWPGAWDLGIKL